VLPDAFGADRPDERVAVFARASLPRAAVVPRVRAGGDFTGLDDVFRADLAVAFVADFAAVVGDRFGLVVAARFDVARVLARLVAMPEHVARSMPQRSARRPHPGSRAAKFSTVPVVRPVAEHSAARWVTPAQQRG
jgi:hypothetical protein